MNFHLWRKSFPSAKILQKQSRSILVGRFPKEKVGEERRLKLILKCFHSEIAFSSRNLKKEAEHPSANFIDFQAHSAPKPKVTKELKWPLPAKHPE